MELMQILGFSILGALAFLGWLIREKFTQLENTDRRVTVLETKLNVLGDINDVLGALKTDIAVIKGRLADKDNQAK